MNRHHRTHRLRDEPDDAPDRGDWLVVGERPSGDALVLSAHPTEADARRQVCLFAGLEGYASITVRHLKEERPVSEPRKNAALSLDDARRRTPPVDPVVACRSSLQLALYGAVSEGDVVSMAGKLKSMAMEGNLPAMKLFFALVTGGGGMSAPAPRVEQPPQPAAVVFIDARTGQVVAPPAALDAPGSEGKLEAMARRAALGQELFVEGGAALDQPVNGRAGSRE